MARRFSGLTRRQAQVLELVGMGYTSDQIGDELGIWGKTVKNHASAAIKALGAKNRRDAYDKWQLAQKGAPDA